MGGRLLDPRPRFLWDWSTPQVDWAKGCEKARWFRQEGGLDDLAKAMGISRAWKIRKRAWLSQPFSPQEKKSKHFAYQEYYDVELRNFIGKLFERDIREFGYDF
jgi:hypothetical protein